MNLPVSTSKGVYEYLTLTQKEKSKRYYEANKESIKRKNLARYHSKQLKLETTKDSEKIIQ
jgi:hypothetical protein